MSKGSYLRDMRRPVPSPTGAVFQLGWTESKTWNGGDSITQTAPRSSYPLTWVPVYSIQGDDFTMRSQLVAPAISTTGGAVASFATTSSSAYSFRFLYRRPIMAKVGALEPRRRVKPRTKDRA